MKREFYQEVIMQAHSMLHDVYALMSAAVEDADDDKGRELLDEARMNGLGTIVPFLQHFKLME